MTLITLFRKAFLTLPRFILQQLDSAPVKEGISDSMRERLMREASTGLDSETKQTNVILYICVGVAVLVVLGGQGILY